MIKIEICESHVMLSTNQAKQLLDYIKSANIEYKFIDGSDFDFTMSRKNLALLIDSILQDGNRDNDLLENLTLVLTESVITKTKQARFIFV